MSEVKVNKISPRTNCGTVTLGDSGDSFVIPAGATITNNGTQTGFGRTGAVNWNTTPITSTPTTGVNGVGYFIDSSGGAKTINLPASPSAGDIMAVSDYAQTAVTNNITIGRNGSNIQGDASDLLLERNGIAITLVYVDATKGWVVTDSGAESDKQTDPAYVTATGGTETTCGNYKIHTFTGPGTFTVSCAGNPLGSSTVSYLVVAGGGGGGDGRGGGGGAGGYREGKASSDCYTASPLNAPAGLPVSVQAYPIGVGSGGNGSTSPDNEGNAGSSSTFSTITAAGGGKGGAVNPLNPIKQGGNGGSGGGAGGTFGGPSAQPGGTGNTPPVSPPQGNNGGDGITNGPPQVPGGDSHGATGGGAGGAGSPATGTPAPGSGGVGVSTSITGSATSFAGGAGGASDNGSTLGSPCGTGGDGRTTDNPAKNGTTNRGGGGGGVKVNVDGGNGGSGIVVIRYKFQG